MIALVTCDRLACEWPEQAVHFALIIALCLQCCLDVGNHLIGWQTVIGVDRAIVSVIRIGSVAPCWIPPARIPVIPSAIHKNDAVVMTAPPTPVVPRRAVVPESPIILTLPVLASLNSSVLLKLHSGVFRRMCVRRQIETLCLVFLTVRLECGGRSGITFPLFRLLGIICRRRVASSLRILCGYLLGMFLGLFLV